MNKAKQFIFLTTLCMFTGISSVTVSENRETAHEKLMNKCYALARDKTDAILAEDWALKARIDRKSISLLKAAIQSKQNSPHLDIYQQMLATSHASLEKGQVDVKEFKRNLQLGSMTQLGMAFDMYQKGHAGNYPENLREVLGWLPDFYLSCPIHKVPYVYRKPAGTVEDTREKFRTKTRAGLTVSDNAPLMVYCSADNTGLAISTDLQVSQCIIREQ